MKGVGFVFEAMELFVGMSIVKCEVYSFLCVSDLHIAKRIPMIDRGTPTAA